MADYPTVLPIVTEGVVAGLGFGQSEEVFAHVIPAARPGEFIVVIKDAEAATRAKANAVAKFDDQARRQLIELLGGTA
jgi:hypothetical protein